MTDAQSLSHRLLNSKTWPYVSQFALEMEKQLGAHLDKREDWTTTSPDELFQALLEQTQQASELLMRVMMVPPTATVSLKADLLKRLVRIASFSMKTADCVGALPEPLPDHQLRTLAYARGLAAKVGELGAMAGVATLSRVRLFIGANEGEETEAALIRYTAAVRLGCARRLERHAEKMAQTTVPACYSGPPIVHVVSSWKGAAAFLREGLPTHEGRQSGPVLDVIDRWKADRLGALKEGILESVFPKFCEAVGFAPDSAATETFRQLLEDFQPGRQDEPLPSEDRALTEALAAPEQQEVRRERLRVTHMGLRGPSGSGIGARIEALHADIAAQEREIERYGVPEDQPILAQAPKAESEKCLDCDGTGESVPGKPSVGPCSTCKGTGELEPEEGPTNVQDEEPRVDDSVPERDPDGYEAGQTSPEVLDAMRAEREGQLDGDNSRPAVTDEGRAEGCLDPSCSDCDMK